MKTFASTQNNDFLVERGSMRLLEDVEAASSVSRHYAQTMRGEMIHKTRHGVPFWPTVFDKVQEAQFASEVSRRIEEIPEVNNVKRIIVSNHDGVLEYMADISTIYGDVTING